jgi:hypothetical protein
LKSSVNTCVRFSWYGVWVDYYDFASQLTRYFRYSGVQIGTYTIPVTMANPRERKKN